MLVNGRNVKTIYLDMDGTIANFYQYPDWLQHLTRQSVAPYEEAAPLVNMWELRELLMELQKLGYRVGIISWLSKEATKEYKQAVTQAKKEWLNKWLPLHFDELHFVQYGTRKDYVAKDKQGIIFDDDERIRKNWRGVAINPEENDILEVLKMLLEDGC